MPWIDDDQGYDYRFLQSGELEYRDRWGNYRIAGGVTADGLFEFQDHHEQALAWLQKVPLSVEEAYVRLGKFRFHCEQCLSLSGITPSNVSKIQIRWLLFARREEGEIIPSPLHTLNALPEPRHPTGPGATPISDKVALLASIASHCNSLSEFTQAAQSTSAREILAVMEERAWAAKSPEDQAKAAMWADKDKCMNRLDAAMEAMGSGDDA